jgi:hypothetical protein
MKTNLFTKQKAIPFIGVFKQLFGGAITWVTMAIFLFSGITVWNTPTMDFLRSIVPWLNLPVFALIVASGLVLVMWSEHKFTQPSVMVYWLKMFWEHSNPMRLFLEEMDKKNNERLDRIEKRLDELSKKQS